MIERLPFTDLRKLEKLPPEEAVGFHGTGLNGLISLSQTGFLPGQTYDTPGAPNSQRGDVYFYGRMSSFPLNKWLRPDKAIIRGATLYANTRARIDKLSELLDFPIESEEARSLLEILIEIEGGLFEKIVSLHGTWDEITNSHRQFKGFEQYVMGELQTFYESFQYFLSLGYPLDKIDRFITLAQQATGFIVVLNGNIKHDFEVHNDDGDDGALVINCPNGLGLDYIYGIATLG